MFDVGGGELLLIVLVILLLFGPKHLPELSRMLGKGWRQLQKAQEELRHQLRELSAELADSAERRSTPPMVPPSRHDGQ
ncbi:Sec-independent protein translocase protein TatA [bacterium HR21]|jgi:sec-independent protein translocase protein TatA|nr:Sec-independent protein translocase protein TatA [bacterium HR21]